MLTYASVCEFAKRFPTEVASFLELENSLRRGRFREETVTDLTLSALLRTGGNSVVLQVPNEPTTGGDMDWTLADPTTNTAVTYRLQAKRLSAGAVNWDRNSYRELAHPKNSGGQAATLIDPVNLKGPPPAIPLYIFYNPEAICTASGASIEGLMLADAVAVQSIVSKIVSVKGKRSNLRQLRNVRHLFFPLTTILCPMDSGTSTRRSAATPRSSVQRYLAATQQADSAASPHSAAVSELPGQIRAALARREQAPIQRSNVKRPRMIFDSSVE